MKDDPAATIDADLRALGRGDAITSMEPLDGGLIAGVWLVSYADGSSVVVKTVQDGADDTFRLEAEGLAAIAATGTVTVPGVVAVSDRLLLLEPLPPRDDSERAWESFARDLAAMHRGSASDRFGWPHENWRGKVRQRNPWTDDGHAFFAEHRLLRYLEEPGTDTALEAADRRAVENLCARLPEIAPPMPPVLTHGDLWEGNVIGSGAGGLALVDPSVSYNWAEVDLALLTWGRGRPEIDRFFAVYQEENPSPAGWEERLPVLAMFELLSWVAHIGLVPLPDAQPIVEAIRSTLAPYYDRPSPAP